MAAGKDTEEEMEAAFHIIQSNLGGDWLRLALTLGLKKNVIEDMINKTTRTDLMWRSRVLLEKWRQQNGKKATVEKLLDAMKKAGRQDLVDCVKDELGIVEDIEDTSAAQVKEETTKRTLNVAVRSMSLSSTSSTSRSQPSEKSTGKTTSGRSIVSSSSSSSHHKKENIVKKKTGKKERKSKKKRRKGKPSSEQDLSRDLLHLAMNALKSMQLAKQKLKKCCYLRIEEPVKEELVEDISQLYDAHEDLCKEIITRLISKNCKGLDVAEMWSSSIYVQMFPETDECARVFNGYLESGRLATDLQKEFRKIGFNCPLEGEVLSMEELEEEVAEIVEEAMDVFVLSDETEKGKLEGELRDAWGDALLRITAWTGDEDKVKTLLQAGVQVNTENSQGETPLWDAVKGGHSNIVALLLQEGADPDMLDKTGFPPLHYASCLGHTEVCRLLVQHTDEDYMYEGEQSPLWIAIENADSQLLRILIDKGFDVHKSDSYIPLCLSAKKLMQVEEGSDRRAWDEHVEVFETLVKAGADVNATDELGQTSLASACIKDCKKTAKLLLDRGADPNIAGDKGRTPVWLAAARGHTEIVSILTQAGADLDKAGDMGWTPLWVAAQNGHVQIAKILTQAGADTNKTDDEERTPLLVATLRGNAGIVSTLTQAGADLNKGDSTGTTPLWLAAGSGHTEIVTILTKAGADLNKADGTGKTPLWVAALKGNTEIVSTLTHTGADLNKADSTGTTPLQVATDSGNVEIVSILKQAGAE
ncbi:uncharacterized protein LOC144911136 [Branchiostoma floridae x Branchiostoma belcheri]